MTGRQSGEEWTRRPAAAWSVRIALFLAPLAAGWLAIRITQTFFFASDSARILVWIAQAIAVSAVVSAAVARLLYRFTPLASLLNMALVFPDQAPSRFRIALRSGTTRKLIEHNSLQLCQTTQEAAEQALVLVNQLSKHEKLTRGHTERVRAYADLIGQELGLDASELNRLRWGALLHDVGKLHVPPEILSKRGTPTDAEWEILRQHPAKAIEMLAPLEHWLGEWILAASQHHERWDGSGYPAGLAGHDISCAGRILAVADAYDVMTSRRSYKDPVSKEAARSELVSSAGKHFDPAVVRALLEVGLNTSHRSNPFGWLFEIPGVARVVNAGLSAPLAIAATVIAVAPLTVSLPTPELAFADIVENEARADDVTTTVANQTITISPASTPSTTQAAPQDPVANTDIPSTDVTQPAANTDTTVTPSTEAPISTTPPTTAPTTTVAPTTTQPLTGCELATSGQTDLPGADLEGCDLSGLTIDGMNFSGANLRNADFSNVTVQNFAMIGADLAGVDLTGARFTDGSFANSTMTAANSTNLSLTRVSLDGAIWRSAVLDDAVLIEVSFASADLSSASFLRANISYSQLRDVTFSGADFGSATIAFVGFEGSNLAAVSFLGASFNSVTGGGAIHQATVCPNGTTTDSTCF